MIQVTHFVNPLQISQLQAIFGPQPWIQLLKAHGFSFAQLRELHNAQQQRRLENLIP